MTTIDLIQKPDYEAFNARIAELAQPHFDKNEPALINALGLELGEDLRLVKAATGLSFSKYLEQHLGEVYEVLPVKANTSGIWPKGKPREGIVNRIVSRLDSAPSTAIRYRPEFWQAFADPVKEERMHRFYDPDTGAIIDADRAEKANWLEIPSTLIRKDNEAYSVKPIQAHIAKWLNEVGLSADLFRASPANTPITGSGQTLLELLIDTLDKRQRQTVTLPLDVIASLATRRV